MMTTITDEYMKELIGAMREYCIVLLRAGPNLQAPGVEPIIWEHARRNLSLRAEGTLPIVCPVADGSEVCGVGIFAVGIETARTIMDGDPGVMKGLFSYELHPCRSFPGDCLPG